MLDLLLLFISAAFVNNIVLVQFLGNCPLLGVSKTFHGSVGMSLSVVFVMSLSSMCTWMMFRYVLIPYDLVYLKTLIFILVIASIVQFLELFLQKMSKALFQVLGIYLPLITTNCAVLGVAILNIKNEYSFIEMLVHSFGASVGFGVVLILFLGIREHLQLCHIPKPVGNIAVALISVGLMALAFYGLKGMGQ